MSEDTEQSRREQLTITQVDASRAFGVSDRTLRRWEKRGRIRGKRVGGVRLYPFAQLKQLVGIEG